MSNPVYIYIDGQNIIRSLAEMNLELDWKKFYDYLSKKYKCKQIYLYFRKSYGLEKTYSELINFSFLLRFCLIHNQVKGKNKANIDTMLVVDALKNYYEKQAHNFILVSGDGDFLPLINFYEEKKHYVGIISVSRKNTSKFLSRKAKNHNFEPRNTTFIIESLQSYTKKVPPNGGEGT